jgi:hypothetical protein
MPSIPSPFSRGSEGELFGSYDEFAVASITAPNEFLERHDLGAGDDHVAFHRLTRELFEERTVYDMTFNYNLARLNLDTRHPNAGYRYAEAVDDPNVLRAEFTPTTPFCPQTHTLTVGSFRAWNGLTERHGYELVRVRSHPMHHQSEAINDQLAEIEAAFRETGTVPDPANGSTTTYAAAPRTNTTAPMAASPSRTASSTSIGTTPGRRWRSSRRSRHRSNRPCRFSRRAPPPSH